MTRLPTYALEKTLFKKMMGILHNFFNFRAHGHSWVELAEPIVHNERFANQQNIYNVGYYFHPLNRYKRFESADPMAYMPIPRDQVSLLKKLKSHKNNTRKPSFIYTKYKPY